MKKLVGGTVVFAALAVLVIAPAALATPGSAFFTLANIQSPLC